MGSFVKERSSTFEKPVGRSCATDEKGSAGLPVRSPAQMDEGGRKNASSYSFWRFAAKV